MFQWPNSLSAVLIPVSSQKSDHLVNLTTGKLATDRHETPKVPDYFVHR